MPFLTADVTRPRCRHYPLENLYHPTSNTNNLTPPAVPLSPPAIVPPKPTNPNQLITCRCSLPTEGKPHTREIKIGRPASASRCDGCSFTTSVSSALSIIFTCCSSYNRGWENDAQTIPNHGSPDSIRLKKTRSDPTRAVYGSSAGQFFLTWEVFWVERGLEF